MEKKLNTLKAELKELANQIRVAKAERKTVRFTGERTIKSSSPYCSDATVASFKAISLADEYRHKHIAYCLIRGRSYDEIENNVRDGNEPNMSYVRKLVDEYDFTNEEKEAYANRNKETEVA